MRSLSMTPSPPSKAKARSLPAWGTTVVSGCVVPVGILIALSAASASLVATTGAVFTLGLMGVGIIGAATMGHFGLGVLLALLNVACLIALASALGMPAPLHPLSMALAMIIASFSFTARGALFSKTMGHRGWLMALFVVAGEASVLVIAYAAPGALPDWFLALLPAQWANLGIQSALTGSGTLAALPVLIALGGTATTTLLAARLWLQRWPYLLMFSAWLGLSALVYFSPAP